MNYWMWLVSFAGVLGTAVVLGTDMFFLTVGRSALKLSSPASATEVMGYMHMFADARMPFWGVAAIVSNLGLLVLWKSELRRFYLVSALALALFVILYNRFSRPINRIQTQAAKAGERLSNARELQASWDRVLFIRVPLLILSLLAQCLALFLAAS